MKPATLASVIRRLAGNTIFRVTFIKRSTGDERVMVCRLHASKGVTGAGPRYNALAKGLLPVYDVQADGWRSVPLDAILNMKIRGVTYDASGKVQRCGS